MKTARKNYEQYGKRTETEREAFIKDLADADLLDLLRYAQGREAGDARDGLMLHILIESGRRHLARTAAKRAKRAKRIF